MLIDSHAHLLDERFDEDRGEVIASLSHKGILAVIECATGPADIAAAAQLAAENPAIYAAVGVHPHDARSYTPKVEAQIRELSRQSKVVAIGEIGLTGDLRSVQNSEKIVREAARMGFERILLPEKNAVKLKDADSSGIRVVGVKRLTDAIKAF